jgi:SAM-dependent methyltransferase
MNKSIIHDTNQTQNVNNPKIISSRSYIQASKQASKHNKKLYESWSSVDLERWNYNALTRWQTSLQNDLLRNISVTDIHSVLDVGCGMGERTALLKKYFPEANVTGIDFSENGIATAKKNFGSISGLEYFVTDATDNSFYEQKKYDLVFSFGVLEHIDDWRSVFHNLVSTSARYLLVYTEVGKMSKFEPEFWGHVRNFKHDDITNEAEKLGMKTIEAFYAGFPFYNPLIKWAFQHLVFTGNGSAINDSWQNSFSARTKFVYDIAYFLLRHCSTKFRLGATHIVLFERK